jgi:hypothetical protein
MAVAFAEVVELVLARLASSVTSLAFMVVMAEPCPEEELSSAVTRVPNADAAAELVVCPLWRVPTLPSNVVVRVVRLEMLAVAAVTAPDTAVATLSVCVEESTASVAGSSATPSVMLPDESTVRCNGAVTVSVVAVAVVPTEPLLPPSELLIVTVTPPPLEPNVLRVM